MKKPWAFITFRYRVMCELKMLKITSDNMALCIFFTMKQ